jgi:NADPH:quinone reductase-like Zn-dependent oxidoreductase
MANNLQSDLHHDKTMTAIVLTGYGDTDKLELRRVPSVEPGPNEIKVRMVGASGDLQAMMPLEFPAILGRDAAGEVVAVGRGVTAFKVGAHVMGLVRGGYAEYVVAAVDAWAEVPMHMDLVDAGALPLVLLTAAQLIEEAIKPREGDIVLVTGGMGSVGRAAIFVAKSHGAKVWAGIRAAQKANAKKLGADGIVAIDDDADIRNLPQLDSIADTVGGPAVERLYGKLKPHGTIGSVVGEPPGAKERGFVVHTMLTHPDAVRLAQLARAVMNEKFTIPIARKLPLSEAAEAQGLAHKGAGGKVVLRGDGK